MERWKNPFLLRLVIHHLFGGKVPKRLFIDPLPMGGEWDEVKRGRVHQLADGWGKGPNFFQAASWDIVTVDERPLLVLNDSKRLFLGLGMYPLVRAEDDDFCLDLRDREAALKLGEIAFLWGDRKAVPRYLYFYLGKTEPDDRSAQALCDAAKIDFGTDQVSISRFDGMSAPSGFSLKVDASKRLLVKYQGFDLTAASDGPGPDYYTRGVYFRDF